MKGRSIIGGLAGSAVLTAMHEITKRINPQAPRMDLLGMQALGKGLKALQLPVPSTGKLFKYTMAGDLVSNAVYYSIAGLAGDKNVITRSAILGLTAGIGAITLPEPMGLNEGYAARTQETKLLTIALYTLGGFAAGIVMKLLQKKR
jgi:hypothetical protein